MVKIHNFYGEGTHLVVNVGGNKYKRSPAIKYRDIMESLHKGTYGL